MLGAFRQCQLQFFLTPNKIIESSHSLIAFGSSCVEGVTRLKGSCTSVNNKHTTCSSSKILPTPNHGSKDRTSAHSFVKHSKTHSQCPTKVAAAVANAPYHKHPTPFSLILSFNNFKPAFPPLVCWVVFKVSMGVKTIRKQAEATLAAMVLIKTGHVRDESRAIIPALAAVSPNRANGPWNLNTGFRHVINGSTYLEQ